MDARLPRAALELGVDTRSESNAIMSTTRQPEPHVGMGATVLGYADRLAATIIKVESMKINARIRRKVTVQLDHAERIDDRRSNDKQRWRTRPNPDGEILTFVLSTTGWNEIHPDHASRKDTKDEIVVDGGYSLRVGMRNHWYAYGW